MKDDTEIEKKAREVKGTRQRERVSAAQTEKKKGAI